MDCEQVQNLLSRFFDRELDRAQHQSVQRHVNACARCGAELATLDQLSHTARSLSEPEPPADLWDRIAGQLAAQAEKGHGNLLCTGAWGQVRKTPVFISDFPTGVSKTRPQPPSRPWHRPLLRAAVLAALVLIAVWTGWLAHGPGLRRGEQQAASSIPAVDLGPYLEEVARGPRISIARDPAVPTSPQEAARQVQFRVLDQASLPEGYSLEESFLVRIEGCSVVQFKYLRGSEVCLLFQYSRGQPVLYGDRPVLATRVNGKPARIVEGDGCLAASWETNGTAVSLIGPRDMSELVRLMAYVDQHLAEGRP